MACDVDINVHMQRLSQSNDTLQTDIDKYLVLATWLFFSLRVIEAVRLFCKQLQQEKGISKEQAERLAVGQLLDENDIKALKEHLCDPGVLHDDYGQDLIQVHTWKRMGSFAKLTSSCQMCCTYVMD